MTTFGPSLENGILPWSIPYMKGVHDSHFLNQNVPSFILSGYLELIENHLKPKSAPFGFFFGIVSPDSFSI